MTTRRLLLSAAGLAVAITAAPASAVVQLPTVERSLSAGQGACATSTYTAPMGGFVTARLSAAGGEWDLYLQDARSGETLSASKAFGSTEVTQAWVDVAQRLNLRACRTAGDVGSATATIDFVDAVKPADTTASIIRIPRVSQDMKDRLGEAGFDLEELTVTKNGMDVFIPSAAKLAAFEKFGIPFKVRIADLQALDRRNRAAEAARAASGAKGLVPSGRTQYRFLADFQTEMAKVVADYPALARPITIGQTVQGRVIQGVELSADVKAEDDGKPTYFLMGVHHAREWPSAEIAMEYIHLLTKSYGATDADGERVTRILDNTRVIVVPVLNQDGYVASRGENPTGVPFPDPTDTVFGDGNSSTTSLPEGLIGAFAYRRKNCNTFTASPVGSAPEQQSLPCYYQTGVDNNRNYGFDWGGRGAGSHPDAQTYRGTGPWSEPENQAVWRTSQKREVTVLITMHTIGSMVLRSPGLSSSGLSPDEKLLKELGDKIGTATGYDSMYGWQLYDTTGTTEDWNYGAVGTLGYTIEIGPKGGVFHGTYKIAVEDQWNGPKKSGKPLGGMKHSLLTAAEYAFDPKTHSILSGTGTPGTELELKKVFTTDTSPLCVFAQGYIASAPPPLDCAAEGTTGTQSTPDQLVYTTKVRPDGTFTWHVTQSTRPFEGYTYDTATKLPKPNSKPREAWTLTCKDTGRQRQVVVERGEQLDLGDVCA